MPTPLLDYSGFEDDDLLNDHPNMPNAKPLSNDEIDKLTATPQEIESLQKVPSITLQPESDSKQNPASSTDLDSDEIDNIINHETGGTYDPGIVSRNSPNHAGLIQFGHDEWNQTAKNYASNNGLDSAPSWDDMRKMTKDEQMPYVHQYFHDRGINADSPKSDYRLAVEAPAAIGKPDDFVVYKSGTAAVSANPAWDIDQDGQVTAGELRAAYGNKSERDDFKAKQLELLTRDGAEHAYDVPTADRMKAATDIVSNQDEPHTLDEQVDAKYPVTDESTGLYTQAFDRQQLSDKNRAESALREQQVIRDAQINNDQKQNNILAEQNQANSDALKEKQQSDLRVRSQVDDYVKQTQKLEQHPPDGVLDPSRWWKSRSGGQTVMAALGRAFSAFGGGEDLVSSAIKNDIDAQRFNISNERDKFESAMNRRNTTYGQMLDRFKDPEVAYNQAISHNSSLTLNKLQSELNNARTDQEKQKYGSMIADVQKQRDDAAAAAINRTGAIAQLEENKQLVKRSAYRQNLVQGRIQEKYNVIGVEDPKGTKPGEAPSIKYFHRNPDGSIGLPIEKVPPVEKGVKFNTDQSRLLATNNDAKLKLQHIAQLRGFVLDPKNPGQYMFGPNMTNMLLPKFVNETNSNIDQNVDSIAPVIGMIQGGGLKPHDEEVHAIKQGLKSKSNNVALAALNSHLQALKNVIEGVKQYPGGHDQSDSQSGQYAPESGTE